jgi:glycosyltransferase involved in cell wall biosynthesis
MVKIAAVCCTYFRPKQLGATIKCFEEQTYENRELIILDDGDQYDYQEGDRWKLFSMAERYPSLADKRNAIVKLASPDVDAYAVMDDDDYYFPWWLEAVAEALENSQWCVPSIALHERPDGVLNQHLTTKGFLSGYHPGWGYRKEAFQAVGGYPSGWSDGEDIEFFMRCLKTFGKPADSLSPKHPKPYLLYAPRYNIPTVHMGGKKYGPGIYAENAKTTTEKAQLNIEYIKDYTDAEINPEVLPRPW